SSTSRAPRDAAAAPGLRRSVWERNRPSRRRREKIMTSRTFVSLQAVMGAALFGAACQVPEGAAPPAGANGGGRGDVVEVEVALTTVPVGVQCVVVAASTLGTSLGQVAFSVTPGSGSTSLTVGIDARVLAPGGSEVTFYGQ